MVTVSKRPGNSANRISGRRPARRPDPFTSGRLSFERGEPLNADFGSHCTGWPPISAQCLYELGRLKSASIAAQLAKQRLGKASRVK